MNKNILVLVIIFFPTIVLSQIEYEAIKNDTLRVKIYDESLYNNVETYFKTLIEKEKIEIDSFKVVDNKFNGIEDSIIYFEEDNSEFTLYKVTASSKHFLLKMQSRDAKVLSKIWPNYEGYCNKYKNEKAFKIINVYVEGYNLLILKNADGEFLGFILEDTLL